MDRNRSTLEFVLAIGRYGLMSVPILFIVIFFFYPILSILWVSFVTPERTIVTRSLHDIVTSPYFRNTIGFTFWQAVVSTFFTLLLAIPSAYVFAHYVFPGKSLLSALVILPFVLPTVVVAAAFDSVIGNNGIVNSIFMELFSLDAPPFQLQRTFAIIIIAHVFYNYPLALRMISGFWTNQSQQIEEAARVLGCSGWRLWHEIRIPLLRPILFAAAVLVFTFTFSSFGTVLILGGPRYATIEVEIYRQAVSLFDLPMAGTLSVIQMAAMFGLMVIYTRLQAQHPAELVRAQRVARRPSGMPDYARLAITLSFMAGLLFAPLLALVLRSVQGETGLTLRYYGLLSTNTRQSILFVPPEAAIWNSLLLATAAMGLSVIMGLITVSLLNSRLRLLRWLDPLFMLPLATSAVTLGFGYIIALDKPPLNLRTSPLLILFAHVLIATPFVVRSVLPALRGIPNQIREAARLLGASPWDVWRTIEFPLIKRNLLVGAVFAFTVSMGEFGASLFIVRPDFPTLPVAIYRLLSQPGTANYGQALALSVILMLVCTAGFLIIDRLQSTDSGEF